MAGHLQCNDYTTLKNYNTKIWRLDNVTLPTKTGLDMFQILFGLSGGAAVFVVLFLPTRMLFGGTGVLFLLLVAVCAGIGAYIVGKIKSPDRNPFQMLKVFSLQQTQQQEEYSNDLHWQVIVVRHPWTTITTNSLPAIAPYTPIPIGPIERLEADSAPVWNVLGRQYATIGDYDDYLNELDAEDDAIVTTDNHDGERKA